MIDRPSPDQSRVDSSASPVWQHPIVRYLLGAACVCLLVGLLVFRQEFRAWPESPPVEQITATKSVANEPPQDRWHLDDFVGSEKCSECHAGISDRYSQHPMAQTLAPVAVASPIEVFENGSTELEAQGYQYRVERDGDRLIHTEFMTTDDGKVVYEQAEEVHYAVGSGVNARTYLIDRGGILFESPITWYTEKGIWDLSPGYHEAPSERFNRRITDGCIQCHSGLPAPTGDGTSARFEKQPFREHGIGCERCHGPGRRHVEMFETGSNTAEGTNPGGDLLIVNPSDLDRRHEDSVCYQCHMGGKRRILRKGKSYHDFEPGMVTEDIWTVFVSPTPVAADASAEFISHVEQMESSTCFRGTEGEMRCTTCHDPHFSPAPDERAAFYAERCNSCHEERGCSLPIEEREPAPILNSCIHCHMPSSGSSDIPHTSASDHRILRKLVVEKKGSSRAQQQAIWTIYDDSDQRMTPWEVKRARALALSEQAVEEGDQRLLLQAIGALEDVSQHDASDVDVMSSLGFFYCTTLNDAQAMMTLRAALQSDPHHELSLKNFGMMALRTGALDAAQQSFESFIEVNAWDGTIFGPYASALAGSGDLQAAVEAVERGLQLDPTQLKLRSFAVQLYARLGDQQKSLQHRDILMFIGKRLNQPPTSP